MQRMDRVLILRKLAELDNYLAQLSEFSSLSETEYQRDWKTQRIVDRTLQLVIECCTDIANHAISAMALTVPTSYAHTYTVLGEAGLLDSGLADTMSRIVRFRNILVHQYTKVDSKIVADILRNRLDDVRAYRAAVLGWLRMGQS